MIANNMAVMKLHQQWAWNLWLEQRTDLLQEDQNTLVTATPKQRPNLGCMLALH